MCASQSREVRQDPVGSGYPLRPPAARPSRPVYAKFAEHYDALFGGIDSACADFVQAVAPAPATLLDAGCGTGRYAALLASRGYRVVGADREPHLLRARTFSAASFVLADLRWLPLVSCFDVVLARGVLNDFLSAGDLSLALRSISSSLAPEGRFIADVREREAHRSRIAKQPVVERRTGTIAFRSSRTMGATGIITSREQFARDGNWLEAHEFQMRTFDEDEVRGLWKEAGLEVLSIARSYGPASSLTDRLVVVARRAAA